MQTETVKLHSEQVLWPSMKGIHEVVDLKNTTPEHIWETTYQGNPVSPAGTVFKREWFSNTRYSSYQRPVFRIISLDTALSDADTAAMSAATVGEMTPDYHLRIIDSQAEHLQFPQLVEFTRTLAYKHNQNNLLKYIIIENKISGTSLLQTLNQSTEDWIRQITQGYNPKVDKTLRYQQAGVWCSNGMVQLPELSNDNDWLYDFEDDLFQAPNIQYKDRMDSFAQMVLFCEHYLSEGYRAKQGR